MTDLGRATRVLDALAESRGPLTVTDLTTRTALPRSTVHRVLQGLERELYVVRVPDRPGWVLGPGLLKFGMNAHLRLLSANRAALAGLAREVAENVELAVFSGREVVVVDQIASPSGCAG
ncbi:helix-turn-helix domain-containing protein [Klenkia terrae]|uniref:helix-turn-helix domain-containing protein n=1 Tax=Klenkia terrae TaxID=1052259 RepID=UPI0036158AB1